MNEPFLPLPLPNPPENGIGPALARVLGTLTRAPRTFVRWFRRIDIREPLSRGEFRPDPRLAARSRAGETGKCAVRFPVLPPAEF
jgi:hypothetical protein